MKIIFVCVCGKTSSSDIEEMIGEGKFYYIATCLCEHCGRLNRVKIYKDQIPHISHDKDNGGHNAN